MRPMSLFTNVPKRSRALLAGLLTLGLLSLLHQPDRRPLRAELLRLRETYREAFASSQSNLSNQFTPGFKSRNVWGGGAGLTWTQGEIFTTRTPTNLAINGGGCFGLSSEGKIAYTRDGRFTFDTGLLSNTEGWQVQAFPLDTHGNIQGEVGPVCLELDPNTNLYLGRYTGFHFDETGKLYGESTPHSSTPLYQIVLYQFPAASGLVPVPGSGPSLWQAGSASGQPVAGVAGQGALGGICPGSLELANVDFMAEGGTRQWLNKHWQAFQEAPSSPVQKELLAELKRNPRLRQAAMDNLCHQLSPGYRSWDILGYLQSGVLNYRMKPGTALKTRNPYDLALEGRGYFLLSSGEITRNGHLIWSDQGLACGQPGSGLLMGYPKGSQKLEPIRIPAQAANLEINARGWVLWTDLAGDGSPECHYQVALVDVNNPQQLERSGLHLKPGKLNYGVPGHGFGGIVMQGALETPNGDCYEERLEAGALLEWAGLPPFEIQLAF